MKIDRESGRASERGVGVVLVVAGDRAEADGLEGVLRSGGHEVIVARSSAAANDILRSDAVDAVVADGLDICRLAKEAGSDVPVVVLTATESFDAAVAALRAGAYDLLVKPRAADLLASVGRAVHLGKLTREVRAPRRPIDADGRLGDLVGDSPVMRRAYALIRRAAVTNVAVLVTGESGTGKELVARAVHGESGRRAGPFVAVNCAAMPEGLLESELFGHERGAFTDAFTARDGLFARANGGTLFLDEIGELPLGLQAKLLRVLQERTVRRIGGSVERPFDVRIVCAANKDLERAVEDGSFRADLWFRINVVHVELPPLRDRGSDILVLARHFLDDLGMRAGRTVPRLTPAAATKLQTYPWPGNVRELRNAIERALVLCAGDHLDLSDLPDRIATHASPVLVRTLSADSSELCTLDEMERRYICSAIEAVGGNKTLAARTLGVDRTTLYRKLERFKIEGGGSLAMRGESLRSRA